MRLFILLSALNLNNVDSVLWSLALGFRRGLLRHVADSTRVLRYLKPFRLFVVLLLRRDDGLRQVLADVALAATFLHTCCVGGDLLNRLLLS